MRDALYFSPIKKFCLVAIKSISSKKRDSVLRQNNAVSIFVEKIICVFPKNNYSNSSKNPLQHRLVDIGVCYEKNSIQDTQKSYSKHCFSKDYLPTMKNNVFDMFFTDMFSDKIFDNHDVLLSVKYRFYRKNYF